MNYVVVAKGVLSFHEQYEGARAFAEFCDGLVFNLWGLQTTTRACWNW